MYIQHVELPTAATPPRGVSIRTHAYVQTNIHTGKTKPTSYLHACKLYQCGFVHICTSAYMYTYITIAKRKLTSLCSTSKAEASTKRNAAHCANWTILGSCKITWPKHFVSVCFHVNETFSSSNFKNFVSDLFIRLSPVDECRWDLKNASEIPCLKCV